MSSRASDATIESTIDLVPRPSARAVQLLFWLHAVPLVLLAFSLTPGPALALIACGFGASWFWLRRHAVFGFGPRALVRMTWHAGGEWTLHRPKGGRLRAELLGSSLVAGGFVLLNFRCDDGARCSRALLGEELEDEVMRRLRARLRVEGGLGG